MMSFVGIDLVSHILGKIGDGFKKLWHNADELGGGFRTNMAKTGAVMMGTGGAAIAMGAGVLGSMVALANHAKSFQDLMILVHTHAGMSLADVQRLTPEVLKLASATGMAPDDLARGLFMISSAALKGVDPMKALAAAAKEASMGEASVEDTSRALTSVLDVGIQSFGGTTKKLTDVNQAMAMINATIGGGKMYLSDFNSAMRSGVLDMAKVFGAGFNEIGGALDVLTVHGMNASEASTRLRMSIALIGAPSDAAMGHLRDLGLTADASKNEINAWGNIVKAAHLSTSQMATEMKEHGLVPALKMLKDHLAMSGLTAEQAERAYIRAFGGGRSSAGILALLNSFDELRDKSAAVAKGADALDKKWQDAQQSYGVQSRMFHQSINSVGIALGLAFIPVLNKLMVTIRPVIDHIRDFALANGAIIAKITPVVGIVLILGGAFLALAGALTFAIAFFTPLFTLIGAVIGGVTTLIGFITAAAEIFGMVAAGAGTFGEALSIIFMGFNPIFLVIAAVIGIGILLITHWNQIKAAASVLARHLNDTFGETFRKIGDVIKSAGELIKTAVTALFTVINDTIGIFFNGFRDAVSGKWLKGLTDMEVGTRNMISSVTGIFKHMIDDIEHVFDGIVRLFAGSKQKGEEWVSAFHRLFATIKAVIDPVMQVFTVMAYSILPPLWEAFKAVGGAIGEVINAFAQVFGAMMSIAAPFSGIVNQSRDAEKGLRSMGGGAQTAASQTKSISERVSDIRQALINFLTSDGFTGFMAFLAVGLPAGIQVAVDWLKVMIDHFLILTKAIAGGAHVISDILHGNFKQAWDDAKTTVSSVGQQIQTSFDQTTKAMGDTANVFNGNMSDKMSQFATNFKSHVRDAAENADQSLGGLKTKATGHVDQMSRQIMQQQRQMGEDVKATATNMNSAVSQQMEEMRARGGRAASLMHAEMIAHMSGLSAEAYGIGANIADGIANGLHAQEARAAQEAAALVYGTLNAARHAGQMQSPSRLFHHQVGAPIAHGVAQGIHQQAHTVHHAAAHMIRQAAHHANQAAKAAKIHHATAGSFKKGHIPWNKGKHPGKHHGGGTSGGSLGETAAEEKVELDQSKEMLKLMKEEVVLLDEILNELKSGNASGSNLGPHSGHKEVSGQTQQTLETLGWNMIERAQYNRTRGIQGEVLG